MMATGVFYSAIPIKYIEEEICIRFRFIEIDHKMQQPDLSSHHTDEVLEFHRGHPVSWERDPLFQ